MKQVVDRRRFERLEPEKRRSFSIGNDSENSNKTGKLRQLSDNTFEVFYCAIGNVFAANDVHLMEDFEFQPVEIENDLTAEELQMVL